MTTIFCADISLLSKNKAKRRKSNGESLKCRITEDDYRTRVKIVAVALSVTMHENTGAFALKNAPLFLGVDAESCEGGVVAAGGAEVPEEEVAAGAATDEFAVSVGSDANVPESEEVPCNNSEVN
jgi:hypothetical protein